VVSSIEEERRYTTVLVIEGSKPESASMVSMRPALAAAV
jgi:hypothetical protein